MSHGGKCLDGIFTPWPTMHHSCTGWFPLYTERTFNQLKAITSSTSNYNPSQIITNKKTRGVPQTASLALLASIYHEQLYLDGCNQLTYFVESTLPRYFVVATDGLIYYQITGNVVTGFLSTKADSIHRVDPMGGQELLYQVKSTNSLWHLDGGILSFMER